MKQIFYFLYYIIFNPFATLLITIIMIPCVPLMRIKLNKKKGRFADKFKPDVIVAFLFILNILIYLYIDELFEGWDGLILMYSYFVFAFFYILDIIASIGYAIYKYIKKIPYLKNKTKN